MTDIPRDEQIARAVREACAKVCEEFDDRPTLSVAVPRRPVDWLILAASAIRSLPLSDLVAALPKEEPVAWVKEWDTEKGNHCITLDWTEYEPDGRTQRPLLNFVAKPLYAAPVAHPDAKGVQDGIKAVLDTVMFTLNNIDKYCREPHQILRETKALRELIAAIKQEKPQ